jgi:homoserine kinase
MKTRVATAFAPASVGNVAVGFDILGHALEGAGDRVTARRIAEPEVRIASITGSVTNLPSAPEQNTAGRAVQVWREGEKIKFGVELSIQKGIALGSGMGGSAASAVAALVAVNALVDKPLSRERLYPYALAGEAVASGAAHGDNVGAQLLGGLVLSTREHIVSIPVPTGLMCVLLHPEQVLHTRRAREVLRVPFALGDFVKQSANLAEVLVGCYRGDLALIRSGLSDVLVEPRRAELIPGFDALKAAALDAGALGASISGAGPSVFAWCSGRTSAKRVGVAMRDAYAKACPGVGHHIFMSAVAAPAARLETCVT